MWPPCACSVQNHLLYREEVFDLIHIIKQLCKTNYYIHGSFYGQKRVKTQRKLIKGSRWLPLKNREKQRTATGSVGKSEKLRLVELMDLNTSIYQAYILKEQLKYVWERGISLCEAIQRSKNRIANAEGMGVKPCTGSA